MATRRKSLADRFREQLLGDTFQKVYHVFCRIVCISTFVVQFAILDVYLITYNDLLWCLWIIPDLLVLGLLLAAAVKSYQHLSHRSTPKNHAMGELPLSYITWFLYAAILSAKFCIIFATPDSIAKKLDEKNFFGPNMLQTGLSLVSIVLYVFLLTMHDTRTQTDINNYIQTIIGSAYVDLLDAVTFGTILLKEDDIIVRYHLDRVTMAIVTFNFLLPSEALLVLSKTYFGKSPLSRRNQLIHKVVHYIIVNLPMFLVRMVIWHLHDQSVSVFLVKNVLGLALAVKDIHDFAFQVTKVVADMPDGIAMEDLEAPRGHGGDIEFHVISEAPMLRDSKT